MTEEQNIRRLELLEWKHTGKPMPRYERILLRKLQKLAGEERQKALGKLPPDLIKTIPPDMVDRFKKAGMI